MNLILTNGRKGEQGKNKINIKMVAILESNFTGCKVVKLLFVLAFLLDSRNSTEQARSRHGAGHGTGTEQGTDGRQGGGGLPLSSVRFFTVGRYSKNKTVISTQLGFSYFKPNL